MCLRISFLLFFVSSYVMFIFRATCAQPTGNVITLDASKTYQTITGWETTAWAAHDPSPNSLDYSPAFPYYKDTLYDLAVNDLGINRVRLEIRSGTENVRDYWTEYQNGQIDYPTWRSHRYSTVNDNDHPDVINWSGFHFSELDNTIDRVVLPLKERVEVKGEKLFINLNYIAFTSQIGAGLYYHHDDPEEYAEFILATFLHLQSKYEWVPDAVEVILEPDNVSQWNGTLIGQAIIATADRLNANGFTPRFIAPSNTNMGRAITYFDQMIQVPGVLQYLEEFSYHRYGGVSDANLQAIASRAVQYGINTSMLEWWSGSNGYQTLHKDIKMGRNSAWQQKTLRGLYDIDETDPNNPIVQITDMTKFTRQYFKYVRSGAVRIEAITNNSSFDPVAFINTDGKYVVVVKASSGASFSVQGLPPGTYGIKYTTNSQYDVDLSDVSINAGQAVTTSIPAAGVITVYAKSSTPVPVELSSFSAEVQGRDVILTWATQSEKNILGFDIQRGQARNMFVDIGFVRGNGTTFIPHEYSFLDKNLRHGKYYYRLKQIDIDGGFEFSDIVEVTIEILKDFALYQSYPNPFNSTTNIKYYVPKLSQVKLVIINLRGQEVVTLVDTLQPPGNYYEQWDATEVSSGIYFYKLQAGEFSQIRKMLLIK